MAATDSGGTTVWKRRSRSSPVSDRAGLPGAVAAEPEAVRVADVVDAGQEGPHLRPVLGPAGGEGHRAVGPAVEGAEEGDDLASAGGATGQLDRRLDRLGTAVAEEHRVEPGGGNAHQGLGCRDELGVVGGARDVPEPVDLLVHRAHHRGMAMAQVGDSDAAGEVEHRPSIEGVQPRPLGGVHHEVAIPAHGRRDQLAILLEEGGDGQVAVGDRSIQRTTLQYWEHDGGSGRVDAFPGQVTPHR